jgi:hypothetical protein
MNTNTNSALIRQNSNNGDLQHERKKRSLSSTSTISSDESTSSVISLNQNKKIATLSKYKSRIEEMAFNQRNSEILYQPIAAHHHHHQQQLHQQQQSPFIYHNESLRNHHGAERPTKLRKEDRMIERQRLINYNNVHRQMNNNLYNGNSRLEKAKDFARKSTPLYMPSYNNNTTPLAKSHLLVNNQYLENNLMPSSTCSSTSSLSSNSSSPPPTALPSLPIHGNGAAYPPTSSSHYIQQQKYVPVELLQNLFPYYLQNHSNNTSTKPPESTVAAAAAAAVSLANTYFQQQIFQQLLQQQQQQHFQMPSHYQNYLIQQADSPSSTAQHQIHLQQRHAFQTASSPLKHPQPILKQTVINKNNELDQVKEHFKRSLGFDCDELLVNKQKTLETTNGSSNKNINNKKFTTSTIHTSSTSITKIKNLDVEDHFIKSLGADYLKRIKKTSETVTNYNNNNDATNNSNNKIINNKTALDASPSSSSPSFICSIQKF